MNKIIYQGTSDIEFIQSLLWRGLCFAAIIYLIFHYKENPPVIAIAGFLCFLVFIISGNDEIIIYSDRVVQSDTSIASFCLKSNLKVYETKDIKAASLPEEAKSSIVDFGIILALASVLPRILRSKAISRIYFDMKNGETITILSGLNQSKLKEIVAIVNSLVSPKSCTKASK